MLTKKIIFFCCSLLLLIACNKGKEDKMIIGKWTGIEWLTDGAPTNYDAHQAVFIFQEDGHYSFQYGENAENGTYYVNGSQLFTTPEGGIKMMVKIPKVTQDTLVFDMNRGGQSEKLTLVRN